jgi:hypothetical protein
MLTKLRAKMIAQNVGTGDPNRYLDTLGRSRAVMSQNHFADTLHINRGRMSQYATGTVRIPAHHLLKLSVALRCAPADLIGYVEMESCG